MTFFISKKISNLTISLATRKGSSCYSRNKQKKNKHHDLSGKSAKKNVNATSFLRLGRFLRFAWVQESAKIYTQAIFS
jgi:hypothetical protein